MKSKSPDLDPKNFRKILLVRHGQYSSDPTEHLTKKGIRQAQLTAKRLSKIDSKIKLYTSDMPRAVETGRLIADALNLEPNQKHFFREAALPGSTLPKGYDRKKLITNVERADQAFELLSTPVRRGQDTWIIVAHGNVIRHWLTRALNIKQKLWLHMDVMQGSITTLRLDPGGKIVLLGFSDVGHLPVSLQTYL